MQLEQIWEYRKPVSQEHIDAIDAALDNEGDLVNSLPIVRTALCCRRDVFSDLPEVYNIVLHDYFTPAVDKVIEYVRAGKTILVWGDYDVDGMTSTAVMVLGLSVFTKQICWAIPNRLEQGYGLDVETIRKKVAPGALIVTVDNGIADVEAVAELKSLGYEVIITDHHLPAETLPDTLIVNPKVSSTPEDDFYMAPGVFVAYEFMNKIGHKMTQIDPSPAVSFSQFRSIGYALVAMGIISDVIPINNLMKRYVLLGLSALSVTKHAGLRALLQMCGVQRNQNITTTFLSYSVIPKLNAAGRMGNPSAGVNLLLMTDDTSANYTKSLLAANELKYLNADRKIIENQICEEAEAMIEEQLAKYPNSLVLYKEQWHSGVLGIVAARMVEKAYRPTIILTDEGGILKGSGRSAGNFDLHGALKKCSDHLVGFGGHTTAAGVALSKENLEGFCAAFDQAAAEANISKIETVLVDGYITIEEMFDVRLSLFLENFEPIGNGNTEFTVCLPNVKVVSYIDKRDVLNVILQDEKEYTVMVSKYRAPEEYRNYLGKHVDILLMPLLNYFSGVTTVEWKIRGIRQAAS